MQSCRELKKYISEGRSIVREIEADTFDENPPLFQEYMYATPEVKAIMDNQFKNVKTHSRLLSKAMWYEWRMKLLDGLKEGLLRICEGFLKDSHQLAQQESLLSSAVPQLVEEHERLVAEASRLQIQADELASCDQEELNDARKKLVDAETEIEHKKTLLADLQAQYQNAEQRIELVSERKRNCLLEIAEAERVRAECRGWTGAEVAAGKGKMRSLSFWQPQADHPATTEALESQHGWAIATATADTLTLTYQRRLSLFLHPTAFSPQATSNAPISLTYIEANHPTTPSSTPTSTTLSITSRFHLQLLQSHLHSLAQRTTALPALLTLIARTWSHAAAIEVEIHLLTVRGYLTDVAIRADTALLAVTANILLRDMRTKVQVTFGLGLEDGGMMALALDPESASRAKCMVVTAVARVVYGEALKEDRMSEYLASKIQDGEALLGGGGVWVAAVEELEQRLRARGRR